MAELNVNPEHGKLRVATVHLESLSPNFAKRGEQLKSIFGWLAESEKQYSASLIMVREREEEKWDLRFILRKEKELKSFMVDFRTTAHHFTS